MIGFSTPKKFRFGSWAIRKYEKSNWSHVFMCYMPSPNSSLPFGKVFQASHGKVNAMHFDRFQEENRIFYMREIELSKDAFIDSATFSWEQLGKPYSFMQLIKIAFNKYNKSNGEDAYICTEFVARALGLKFHKAPDYIGLNDMYNMVRGL